MPVKIFTLSLLLLLSSPSYSEKPQKPLWEVGVGLFSMQMPHYLGSDQSYRLAVPMPALIYRGDIIKSDRKGIRSEFFQSPRWLLSISVNGALPVNSEDNRARKDMDDLDPIIEFGPRIQYHFTPDRSSNWQLYFDLPVRAAFSFDGAKPTYRGYNTNPALASDFYRGNFRWSFGLGPQYADKKFHGYFYDIGREDVLTDRPYYQSSSGYTGFRASSSLSYRKDNWRYSAFFRYYDLNNASNENSPLLLKEDYLSVGFTLFYYLKSSSKTVYSR